MADDLHGAVDGNTGPREVIRLLYESEEFEFMEHLDFERVRIVKPNGDIIRLDLNEIRNEAK